MLEEIIRSWTNIREVEIIEILLFCFRNAQELYIMQFPEKELEQVLGNMSKLDSILYVSFIVAVV